MTLGGTVHRPHRFVALAATLAVAAAAVVAVPSGAAPPPNATILTLMWTTGGFYSLDPTTAAPSLIGTSNLLSSTGIEWDETTQTLFGIDYDNVPASLYTIDPETGTATVVGSMGIARPTGIASRPWIGTLFIVYDSDGGSMLATVDKATAAVTDIGPVITDQQEGLRISAIAFRRGDGALFGFRYNGDLVEINPATGVASIIAENVYPGYGADFDCDDNLLALNPDNGTNVLARVPTDGSTPTIIGSASSPEDLAENLTVVCGTTESTTTTTAAPTTTGAPTTTTAPPAAVTATPRFTG